MCNNVPCATCNQGLSPELTEIGQNGYTIKRPCEEAVCGGHVHTVLLTVFCIIVVGNTV